MALGKHSDACHCGDVRTGRNTHHLAAASVEGGVTHFLDQKKNTGDPFPGSGNWRLPNAGRGAKRCIWPTLKDVAAC